MAQIRKTDNRLTAEAYMAWYELQPAGRRYELLDGVAYEMQSERLVHAEVKARVAYTFRRQIGDRGLPCQALGDGMAVAVDEDTVFEPDALVRCGQSLPGGTLLLPDPLIVVEVASPSTQHVDVLAKFSRYFRNPHIVHYLIVIPSARTIIHHRRAAEDRIESKSYEAGTIPLDPPGLDLDVVDLFADMPTD